ncbi:aminoglycoside phosphotransferase (APT) family kinase protein [Nocardioides albertanoniae]|uniref:Aminoglycoside phosphotransferase (APT) family kinase protein n=1 Tax=Nocardioides albertanoniae TaxID=1175486 RepID=A0A543A4L9_9ACTN|nr:phosphotransferase [Nocardioides albertanoniae]TQL67543.1 aminoglycoside phosphotransferase (APT) family kinase protein [Nocardioides albertanoniae]
MSFGELGGGLQPLDGGWSGETFLADAGGDRSVVRVFANPRHHPQAAEIQEALHRLVRGLVAVPAVLEVRRADPAAGMPALLVTEFVEGARADQVLSTLDETSLADLGRRLGQIAGTLAGMPFLTAGTFVDGDLRVDPFALDLPEWVESHAERLDWSTADLDALRDVAASAQDLLYTVTRVSLVHSDLNPKNIVVDPHSLQVRAVLDWEFTHAGSPFTDLGNLLRFDRDAAYVAGVLEGYVAQRGGSARAALDLARAADLFALVELAARRTANPVAARAHDLLHTIARREDIHAD